MIRICLLLLGLVAASPSLSAQDPPDMNPAKKVKLPYTVGKKTTFLEGPFDKEGRSVGKNERDDGGQAHGDDPQGDDIVVRLPRPKRKAESQ